ncbi:MAG: radical SAM protein [Deltaproteobacteria bacterium]
MTEGIPFIARFRTPQAYYAYDVNTNEVVRISRCISEVLGDWGKIPHQDLVDKYSLLHGRAAVLAAVSEINAARQEAGLFSSSKPEKLQFPHSLTELKAALSSRLEHLILNITERCNLSCRYCLFSGHYPYQRRHSPRDLEPAVALKAVDFFMPRTAETNLPILGFFGGEPLLRLDLIRAVLEHVRKHYPDRRISVSFSTNGLLLRGEILKYLVEQDVLVRVSLDGPRQIHDRMRVFADGRGSFDIVVRNLKEAKRRYPEYFQKNISMGVTIHTPKEIEEIYNLFQNGKSFLRNCRVSLSYVDPHDTTLFDKGVLAPQDWQDDKFCEGRYLAAVSKGELPDQFLKDLFDFTMLKIHRRPMTPLGLTHYPNGICFPGVRRLYCTVDGDFSVCERVNPGLHLGHIDQGIDADRAWEVAQQYAEISSADCRDCWAVRLCSLCFCHLQRDQFDLERKRSFCPGTRAAILDALSMYCSAREVNDHAFDYLDEIEVS